MYIVQPPNNCPTERRDFASKPVAASRTNPTGIGLDWCCHESRAERKKCDEKAVCDVLLWLILGMHGRRAPAQQGTPVVHGFCTTRDRQSRTIIISHHIIDTSGINYLASEVNNAD
jgi:hypothetical protein